MCPLSLVVCHLSLPFPTSFFSLFLVLCVCALCFLLWNRVSVYSTSWPWTQNLVSTPWALELQAWATIPTIVCLCIFISLSSPTFHTFLKFYLLLILYICFLYIFLLFITHFIFWMIFLWSSLQYLHRYLFGEISDFCIVFNIYQGKSQVTIGSSCLNIQPEDSRDLLEILRLYWIFVSSSTLSVRSSLKCGNPVALVTSAKC